MAKVNQTKLADYKPDERNVNKGSQYGDSLLEKSIRETGLGRSIEVDKNGNVMSGNKTLGKAVELGFENAIEIETDGKTLVVVKRTDLDINSKKGIKHKILDNTVSKHNYVEDAEVFEVLCEEIEIEPVKLGLPEMQARASGVDEDGEEFDVPMFPGGKVTAGNNNDASKEFKQQVFPIGVVLSKQELTRWQAYKTSIGISRDTEAFGHLLNSVAL